MTSDSRFPGGVGKIWEEGGFEQILGDVSSRVFDAYGDDTVVYPGPRRRQTLGRELRIWRSGASAAGETFRHCRPVALRETATQLHAAIDPDALHAFRRTIGAEVLEFLEEVTRLAYLAET